MKNLLLYIFLLASTILNAQNNNNPTIAVCNGNQYVCATGIMSQICVNIIVDPTYPNASFIDSFEIRWGDGSPNTWVLGSLNPPSQTHTYDLTGFYGTCTRFKEYDIKLLTHHTNGDLPANNSFTLTFINPPQAKINISDPVICLGQSVTISDNSCPTGFTNPDWDLGDGTIWDDVLSMSHTYMAAGTYTITHTVSNQCGNDSETATVSVINEPVADVKIDSGGLSGIPPVVCLGGGGLVKLNAQISQFETSYMWSVSPGSGWQWWPLPIPAPTGPFPRIQFTQPGTYTITVKVNNDCDMPDEKSIQIKVVDAPQLNLNGQPDGCLPISYSPVPFSAAATYTINGVVQSSFPVSLPIAPTPYIVEATLSNECGMQIRHDTFSLTAPQDVSITNPASNLTVCTGSAPIILEAAPAGGNWSGQHISQSGGNTVFTPPNAPGVFTLKYTRGTGNCERSDDITITVEQSYNLQLAPQPDACVSLNYSPNPNDPNVQYSINGVIQTSFPINLAVSPTPYMIEATVTNVCGTKLLQDTFWVIDPVAVSIAHPVQDTVVCQNTGVITLNANPTGGIWQGQFISGPPGAEVFTPSNPGVFPLIYIRGQGNCERRDTISVTVEAAYNLQLIPQPDDCISLQYSPNPLDPNVTYTLNNAPISQFPVALTESLTPFHISASYTNVCGTTTLTDTFQILSPTPVDILAPLDTTICQFSDPLPLTSTPDGGTWIGVNVSGTNFIPNIGGVFDIIYSRGTGNCEQQDTVVIEVIAVNIEAGPADSTCLDDSPLALTGFSPASGGVWTGTGIANPSGQFDPGTAGTGSHVLSYTFVDPVLGCTFRDSLVMTVHPMPESAFAPPTNTCINELVQFQNQSASTFQVLWQFGDGQTSTDAQASHIYTDTGTYLVTLTTTNQFGCTDMASQTIFVTEPPFAFFTPAPDTGCAVLPVSFQNGSYGWQTNYQWTIGNLYSDTLFNPAPIMLPGGTKDTFYVVTLTATNLCAVRTWTDSILVHPLPLPHFGTNTDTVCSGETIFFANTSLGQPETYFWDFGNGQFSTDSLSGPVTYFTDSLFRTYTIRLIASNFCGIDTFEHDIVVKPVDVKAFFNVPNLIGCQPYTVQFNNFATPGATVSWQFGDGNTSADPSPQHTYVNPGTYKVVQKATAGCGFDSTISYITVLPAPEVSFTSLPQICRNDTLQFINTSPDALSGVHWDFGDGDTSVLNNPLHAFETAGLQTVTFTGISAVNGCPGIITGTVNVLELPNVQFSADKPDGCVPLSVTFQIQPQGATYFEWNFGDGNTKVGATATHVFVNDGQYEVSLLGIDVNGCRNDTLLRYITVHPIPSPAFTMQRDRLCGLPVTVNFTNDTPDAAGFSWIFGDGAGTSQQNNPQYTYTQAGDYTVQLIAENAFLCKDTLSQVFSAYAQPVADFSWDPEEGCAPLEVRFDNLSSNDTDARWFFTDGAQSDSFQQTTHTFYAWGKHGATLIASHRNVCFDTLTLPDIIEVYPSPTANFSFEEIPTNPPSGQFEFTDLSVDATRWLWDFGDGGSSEEQHPAHRYFSNGPKVVTLTVWGENGCPDDTVLIVTPRPMHGLYVPNAFTPGLDNGEASIFQPKGVGLKDFEIAVYSSYGQLLWSSGTDDLLNGNPGPGWDGTYKGNPMPQDVYTWQVIRAVFDDGTVWDGKKVGSVTLIR